MESPTLLTRWANVEVDALEAVGFDATSHLRAHGWTVNREPGWGRMPWPLVASMWKAAEKATGDESLGLHAAGKMSFAQPGFVAYAMLSGANLRETFGFLDEFQRLCIDARIFSIAPHARGETLVLHAAIEPTPSKQHAEFLFSIFTRACRHIVGDDFAPEAIHLRRTVPSRVREYTEAFGCPVYWDQKRDEMVVAGNWLQHPSPYSHPDTFRMMRERATQFMLQYTAPSWSTRVASLIERLLPDGGATIRGVAQNLGVSPRTLQRRLEAENAVFDDLRESVRRARALELVGKDHVTIASIARELGFSDARAFRRAFRRWTGTAPSDPYDK